MLAYGHEDQGQLANVRTIRHFVPPGNILFAPSPAGENSELYEYRVSIRRQLPENENQP
jgi:hypothetical protein